MEKSLLLSVLLYFTVVTNASDTVLYVTPDPGKECPTNPCHTLSYYAHNISTLITASTKFVFLPGTHYLDTDFRVSNISSLVLLGDSPEQNPIVTCTNNAAIVITEVSRLLICMLKITCSAAKFSLSIEQIENFTVNSFHLLNSTTLHIYNSTALLEDTNFTNNTGTGCGGSVRIEYSNVTLNGTNSFAHSHTSESGGGMCVIGSSFIADGNIVSV